MANNDQCTCKYIYIHGAIYTNEKNKSGQGKKKRRATDSDWEGSNRTSTTHKKLANQRLQVDSNSRRYSSASLSARLVNATSSPLPPIDSRVEGSG